MCVHIENPLFSELRGPEGTPYSVLRKGRLDSHVAIALSATKSRFQMGFTLDLDSNLGCQPHSCSSSAIVGPVGDALGDAVPGWVLHLAEIRAVENHLSCEWKRGFHARHCSRDLYAPGTATFTGCIQDFWRFSRPILSATRGAGETPALPGGYEIISDAPLPLLLSYQFFFGISDGTIWLLARKTHSRNAAPLV